MNILLADDEPGLCELLAGFLEDAGHVVHTTRDGQEAWGVVSELQTALDVVIADIKMPVMGGRELIRRMQDAALSIPVVLISGQVNITQEDAVLAGAFSILHKPFELAELQRMLDRVQAAGRGA